jgi:predicted aspartyl protease
MIRYAYNRQLTPPAPFAHVTLRSVNGARELTDLPAQLDSGADRTVVPSQAVELLGLVPVRELDAHGVAGERMRLPTFLVEVEIRQLQAMTMEVLASPHEPFVLLGRDILNQFRIVLEGPQLAFEIG